jgi:hypothetical protein
MARVNFSSLTQRTCGYRWYDEQPCADAESHECWRASPEHHSHMCTCEAIELRTSPRVSIAAF